jgi:hypothetical protein
MQSVSLCGGCIYSLYVDTTVVLDGTLTDIKPMWNFLTVNFITNSCFWNTCVTWQGIVYKLSEDDTIVSKHVAVW